MKNHYNKLENKSLKYKRNNTEARYFQEKS